MIILSICNVIKAKKHDKCPVSATVWTANIHDRLLLAVFFTHISGGLRLCGGPGALQISTGTVFAEK